MKTKLFLLIFSLLYWPLAIGQTSERIIIVTLDGMRWQELFTGADENLLTNKSSGGSQQLSHEYWRETPELRRKVLMPFVWGKIATLGVLHGNRLKKSEVNVSNKMWFSYPGYNEILTGKADDEHITSNDKFYNPNKTILEELNENSKYKGSVAAFCGWDVFPYIINDKRSGVYVNAGFDMTKDQNLTDVELFLNENLNNFPIVHDGVRPDVITQGFALAYMRRKHPKVTYISYAQTDDFAHQNRYDYYLKSAHAIDNFLMQLWEFTQKDPFYKGKTTFIVTTDHGRGVSNEWTSHGSSITGANQTWLIEYGAGITPSGEVTTEEKLYSTQVVKDVKKLLKL